MNVAQQADYMIWIEALMLAPGFNKGYGACEETCVAMADEFPELEIRKGTFDSVAWGLRTHWWCRIGDRIVDPTAQQHPDGEFFPATGDAYEDLTDVTEEDAIAQGLVPSGKCVNCGDPIWGGRADGVCSDECGRDYVAYVEGGGL